MRTFSLQSGSNGNCIYVESDGVGLLFDAGISGLQAQRRLADRNRDIRRVAAVILSHDHVYHVRCAGIYQRKFDVPIYATPPTFRKIKRGLGRVDDVRHFAPGDRLDFGVPHAGLYLQKLSWVRFRRHTLVRGNASPDDPAMACYWATRRAWTQFARVAPGRNGTAFA
ncbi:MAG TPA: MBL fold metallo-hydrolase [Phycisphaerae bacterium]|nr:MBL fold metallo-hydrolase [Phycisphaerae bacterium]